MGKVNKGYFRYVICDVRAASFFQNNFPQLCGGLVLIDGEDSPAKTQPGPFLIYRRETDGYDFSIPLPMAIPEEVLAWITSYDNASKPYSIGFGGGTSHGERKVIAKTMNQLYPDVLFQTSAVPLSSESSPEGRLSRDKYLPQSPAMPHCALFVRHGPLYISIPGKCCMQRSACFFENTSLYSK